MSSACYYGSIKTEKKASQGDGSNAKQNQGAKSQYASSERAAQFYEES
jgi:hypothetical protein